MTADQRELVTRYAELRRRCAAERNAAVDQLGSVRARLAGVDRGLQVVQRWSRSPVFIAAGIASLVFLARSKSRRRASALLGLLGTGIKLRSVARRIGRAGSSGAV